jgi:membrane-associated phospholipid phosphatase
MIITLLFALFDNCFPQTSDDDNYLHFNKTYIKSYFSDGISIAKSPARWNEKQWINFAAFGGAVLLLYTQDDNIQEFFVGNQTASGLSFSNKYIDPLANWYLAGMVGGMYIYGLASQNPREETAALLTAKSVILAGSYTLIFKGLFQRQRPNHNSPPHKNSWDGPFGGFRYGAFPSGHTAVAFAAAATLSTYYRDKKWVGISAYTFAVAIAVSRLYENKHWSSDVLAGAALGYAIARLVYNNHRCTKITVAPSFAGSANGITFQYSF